MRFFYILFYVLLWIPVHLVYPMIVTGREFIPEGACIICANHSNYIDPLLLIYVFGLRCFLHSMSKQENLDKPILGWIYRMCGAYGVKREGQDATAVRKTLEFLKNGEKVVIFPEGTRTPVNDPEAGKSGAVRFASKLHIPLLPVFITRNKSAFRLVHIHIGHAYEVVCKSHEENELATKELMETIFLLGEKP